MCWSRATPRCRQWLAHHRSWRWTGPCRTSGRRVHPRRGWRSPVLPVPPNRVPDGEGIGTVAADGARHARCGNAAGIDPTGNHHHPDPKGRPKVAGRSGSARPDPQSWQDRGQAAVAQGRRCAHRGKRHRPSSPDDQSRIAPTHTVPASGTAKTIVVVPCGNRARLSCLAACHPATPGGLSIPAMLPRRIARRRRARSGQPAD